jgi:predicted DNA-binding protein
MKNDNQKVVSCRVTDAAYQELVDVAEKTNKTVSEILSGALDVYLKELIRTRIQPVNNCIRQNKTYAEIRAEIDMLMKKSKGEL